MPGKQVPQFKTEAEERRFWDEHSAAEVFLASERKPNTEAKRPLSSTFAIRLDSHSVELIRQVAKAKGGGATQLARMWIMERLQIERDAGELAEISTTLPEGMERAVRADAIAEVLRSAPELTDRIVDELPKEVRATIRILCLVAMLRPDTLTDMLSRRRC